MFRTVTLLLTFSVVLSAAGCQGSRSDEEHSNLETTPEQADVQSPREVAMAAQRKLFEKLSTQLVQTMSSGGPTAAIPVCKQAAPRLAKEVGEELGVAIGRTSFRLRNAQNLPPEWAMDWVEQRVEEPQFVDLPDGRFGSLLPIRLKPQCLACHGPEKQIAEDVKATLKREYPDDQAMGFRDGDLRGWFWVEVPAKP